MYSEWQTVKKLHRPRPTVAQDNDTIHHIRPTFSSNYFFFGNKMYIFVINVTFLTNITNI